MWKQPPWVTMLIFIQYQELGPPTDDFRLEWPVYTTRRDHYLPMYKARRAEKMAARLDLDVLVVFGAYFAKLEGWSHLAVELILFLRDADVIFAAVFGQAADFRINRSSVWKQVAAQKHKPLVRCNRLKPPWLHLTVERIFERKKAKVFLQRKNPQKTHLSWAEYDWITFNWMLIWHEFNWNEWIYRIWRLISLLPCLTSL